MNGLSWFIYLIDVLASLSGKLSIVLVLTFFGLILAMGTAKMNQAWSLVHPESSTSKKEAALAVKILTNIPKYIKVFVVLLIVQVAIPSERTMYMIAGSELGEDAIASDTGKRVHDAINKKLDEYLAPVLDN